MQHRNVTQLFKLVTDERHITAQTLTGLDFANNKSTHLSPEKLEKFRAAWCDNIRQAVDLLNQAQQLCEKSEQE